MLQQPRAALPADTAPPARWLRTAGPIAAYLALCFIWGSTYLAIRLAVQSIPPLMMVGARSVIAGAILAGLALATGAPRPDRRALARAALSGVLLFLGGQVLLAIGEQRVPSGQAAVLGALLALFLPLASWSLGEDVAPTKRTILALLVGFAGVAVLVRPGAGVLDPLGGAIVLGSNIVWAYGGAVSRRYPATASIFLTSGLQMLLGGAACLLVSAIAGEFHGFSWHAVTARSWFGFVYLIAMGSMVGFSAFAWLVRLWPPQRLATYTYVNPIVALLLGAAIAGETLTAREILATALILAAVAVVLTGKKPAAAPGPAIEE
jgi:drug/metabolite transporter (DMT)-like permease